MTAPGRVTRRPRRTPPPWWITRPLTAEDVAAAAVAMYLAAGMPRRSVTVLNYPGVGERDA